MNNLPYVTLLLALLFLASGCKKAAREVLEETGTEMAERAVREGAEEGGEALARQALRTANWDDLLEVAGQRGVNYVEALKRVDGDLQEAIVKATRRDPDFFDDLMSSSSLLDEFTVFVHKAPECGTNIDWLRTFVRSKRLAKEMGKASVFTTLRPISEQGTVRLLAPDGTAVATYRDGVMRLLDPFKPRTTMIDDASLLREQLLPNTLYRIDGKEGLSYLYHVDELARVVKIESHAVDPDALLSNVVHLNNDVHLGNEWQQAFRRIKQHSRGGDVHVRYHLSYTGNEPSPRYVNMEVKVRDKSVVNRKFKNQETHLAGKALSQADHHKVVYKYASRLGLDEQKAGKLLQEMEADPGLAKLIHADPELNIKRWRNTRNPVDKKRLDMSSGKAPINAGTYAGNVYYFNPHLNSKLKHRISKGAANLRGQSTLSYDELVKLDKLYPDGVPFTKEGYPDFSHVAAKGKDGRPIVVDIGELTGESAKDIATAREMYRATGQVEPLGHTWHHVEHSSQLILVPTHIHQLVDHSGGMSTHLAKRAKAA